MPSASRRYFDNQPKPRVFYTPTPLPEVAKLSSVEGTDFVPSLEHSISPSRNAIYAPTLLYAWEELVRVVGGSITTTEENSDYFLQFTNSNSHTNALRKNEYSIEVTTSRNQIKVKAFFHKSLAFSKKLERIATPLLFKQTSEQKTLEQTNSEQTAVASFGTERGANELSHLAEIAYYQNDSHFVLRLSPKDRQHEIILAKGIKDVSSLGEAVEAIYQRIEQGKAEKKNPEEEWKYKLDARDSLIIPLIAFHLESNYAQIEGQRFLAQDMPWWIIQAHQRTALVLDENGAVVESEGIVSVVALGIPPPPPPPPPKPKHLVFDQSFYLLLKGREQSNPYLVVKIENAQLLSPVS